MSKKFVVYRDKDKSKEIYYIHFSYRTNLNKNKTKRVSTYFSLKEVKKAGQRFLKNGYSLVESIDKL